MKIYENQTLEIEGTSQLDLTGYSAVTLYYANPTASLSGTWVAVVTATNPAEFGVVIPKNILKRGDYTLYAVVDYVAGEQYVSEPVKFHVEKRGQ